MALTNTPQANRLHIAFYGRRNAGKSSLINLMTNQNTALVSDFAGTTTDPVIKSMELSPLGPIAVIDTAGFDDEGELGALRIARTKEMLKQTDMALLVISAEFSADADFSPEIQWAKELKSHKIHTIGILNQADRISESKAEELCSALSSKLHIPFIFVSAVNRECRSKLLSAIIKNAPTDFEAPTLTGDLFNEGDTVVLVCPQDIQAPKGRLILPQVQVIRDILDHGGLSFVCTADKFENALASLGKTPDLVITDSQVFPLVNALTPSDVPLTSFSIIMARSKGDLNDYIAGAQAIKNLRPTDKILIAEACTHAPLEEDIGRVKIPRMLRKRYGETLQIDIATGLDFPDNLKEYALILHCGGCMFTRKQLMSRTIEAREANVPITNYGLAIAQINGILERVTEVFVKNKK